MIDLTKVGDVIVDSGRVAIVDACHVFDEQHHLGTIGKTNGGDGTYPVFRFTQDGIEYLAVQLTNVVVAEVKRRWQAEIDAKQN